MDKIEVSQRAREAAADLLRAIYHKHGKGVVFQVSQPESPSMLNGERDNGVLAQAFARFEHRILATRTDATPVARKQFPILGSRGAKIDLQLVEDHGKQAYSNHYQTVERLAERGGLSWCELHAVLNNRPWQKLDENTAIAECRAIEARYLGAFDPPATDVAALVEAAKKIMPIRVNDGPDYAEVYFADGTTHSTHAMTMNPQDWLDLSAALAPFTKGQNDDAVR